MALMDADYKRHPKNKYISNMVNYTLDVRWIQCLHWSNKHWNSEDCSPQEGAPATGFTCSCAHIGTYTTASRRVSSQYNVEDVSQFVSPTKNLIPPVVVGICALIYILLMFSGKIKDQHEDPKDGFVFLQDNSPRDQQQYAVMVDVGFRSRPKTTAKVYIILHGQDGVSETRELYGPEKPLFGRNSRHIFIMSVPESLGPLWKIHIWHNNIGQSPSIYLSHVIVKDLHSGASWLFYAECWLAIDEGDGKVERELTSVGHGLGFRRLFYCKFTEYLEDFHLWGSVFSRPSYSWFSRRQRITACFVLLLGYMCLNAVLIHWEEEQFTVEIGLTGISAVSMSCGLKVTAAVYPLVVLLSLLFRFSQKQFAKDSGESRIKVPISTALSGGHQQSASAADTGCESNLTWQHLQYWAYDAWKTKYERDFSTSSAHLQNDRRRSKNRCPSVSTQGSSGFEDCSSNNGGKTGLEDFKDCEHGSRPPYSSDRSLSENSVFHGSKVLPAWCVYVAWAVSAAIIMICVTAVGAVGFRFGATRCVLWFHALFFSLIYCIFIIQPSLIFLAALFVAWQKRQRTDFFCEALSEDVKYIVGEPGLPLSRQRSHEKSNFEKILAARRRARYLRLARPPTPAQLKMAKDKLRRKTIIGKIFRELAVYIIMASMLISIIVGQSSPNEYSVNGAVRDVFTRNAKQPFTEIRTMDDWWNFGFNVLLDGLYWKKWHDEDSLKEVGPIEGKFYIIGDPLMRKLDGANDSSCAISPFSTPAFPDCTLSHLPNGAKDTNFTTKIQDCTFYQCGKIQCYEDRGPVINLGRSRTEAHAALWKTREQQWVDRRTRAVLVQFLLYNPPTNLFTAVSLLTELPASGDIITSSRIDSISIYRITAPMDYVIMMIELMYLGMVFICFYLQLNTLVQRGVRSYWHEPWNWVEASIIGLSLGCYGCQVYHFMLTVDATDQLQRRFFKVFINFSLLAGVEKWARCLHRMLLFLMMIRFIKLLRFYKRTAPWVAVFQHSCSHSAFTMHIGVVFIMAFSSSGYLIFSSESYAFCSALSSLQTICVHLLGVRGIKHIQFLQNEIKSNHVSVACFYGALFIAFTILWTGMLKEILTSVGKYSKKAQRSKHLVTLAELASHTRRLVLSVVCGQRQKQTDGVCVTSSSYYLDEFEDLIDELLFRLNAISNGLHHSLPAKSQSYTEEEGDGQNSDSRSDLSFKQTEENTPRGERRRDSFTLQTERAFSDVLGINLSCLPQGLEGASRNGYRIPEEVLSKLNYSEDAINHDECGLPVANSKQCLEVSQQADAPQYLPRDEKAILPPVLYMHPFANASNLKYDKADCKTRCTSANIQNKSCRPLRRSHTTVLQPLGSSTTALWKKSNGHGRKASANLNNEGHSEQPQCNVFHQSFREVLNEKESTQTHVETATRRFQQTPISTIIQRDDKTPPNTNASVIPCSVKQCW
ncbi:hypothetical protein GDO78_018353 [Eleutherodactylus coqui]|uniref:Polycystin-1-like protein 1 n=1 Tax=Eleutherodactylus coqui TaxID=57060 RepID=A0A8J6JUX4_ELECQ|nr:hypothetical protein GDO78_018353 [Eleutherodactylus coqui]